jgi:hypothetical protein
MTLEELGGEWREHPEAKTYFLCRDGRAARVVNGKARLLIGCACGRGYRAITWARGGKLKRFYIHRAVCEIFNGPSNGLDCRHLNGDMFDNSAANLAWGTPKENSADMLAHGTVQRGEKNPMAKLTSEQVAAMREIRRAHNTPYYQIAPIFNVSTMTAFRAITEQSWK